MSSSDRIVWEQRYKPNSTNDLPAPSSFLLRHLPALRPGLAVDLACGSGRNSIALARAGFRVHAIDIAHAALRRLHEIARREQLAVECVQADLEDWPLPRARYDLVVNVRYLQRSLLQAIAAALAPGGHLLFETFLIAQRDLGHPRNPAFLLEPGELRDSFSTLAPVEFEEGLFETESGPAHLARLFARRT